MGRRTFDVKDSVAERSDTARLPRLDDDYSEEAIRSRQRFVEDFTGETFDHLKRYSYDPQKLPGNIEAFTFSAQVPIGMAGPLTIHGEHAKGDFLIPMATTE